VVSRNKDPVNFALYSCDNGFCFHLIKAELTKLLGSEAVLKNQCGFTENGEALARARSRDEIHAVLRQIAVSLESLPTPAS
jgi:hypothetical protein